MSVTVQDVTIRDEKKVGLDVSAGPVLTKRYGSKTYRVTRVIITYHRTNNGLWATGGIDLSGPFVKKDGTDGADSTTDHLWSRKDWEALGWLTELIERYQP